MTCSVLNPFDCINLKVNVMASRYLDAFVQWARPFFQAVRYPMDLLLTSIQHGLAAIPQTVMILVISGVAFYLKGIRFGVMVLLGLCAIGLMGLWAETMQTMAIVLAALLVCLVIGIPLGILCAKSDALNGYVRPVLDAMQTIPIFVYLIPVVMLFGIGNVPGAFVTAFFAIPPVIRLTNLGIRQVPIETVEAMLALGATQAQVLFKAEIPYAKKSIMAGINQTLMLSLSMVVVGSMIAVGGLGQVVLRGMGSLDLGTALVGGLGIVLLAIMMDRITEALGEGQRERGK